MEDKEIIKKQGELLSEAIELLKYFTDRVEIGSIRSKTTYKKYKDFLDKASSEPFVIETGIKQ